MTGSVFGRLATLLVAALVALVALPGAARAAQPADAERPCIAYGSLAGDPAQAAVTQTRWDCRGSRPSLAPERLFLRFALPTSGETPEYLTFRRAAFERLHLMTVAADGSVNHRAYTMNDMAIGKVGAFIRADLPPVTAQSRYVFAAIDLPTHSILADSAQLARGEPLDDPEGRDLLLLLAVLCGMLMMPLVFNVVFYRVLREQFLLWHAAMAATLLGTIVFTSGLSAVFVDLGMGTLNSLMALVYGGSVSAGALFAWSFIEPGRLHPLLRRALPLCAAWSMVASAFHAFFPFVLRPIQTDLYYAAYLPILIVFLWAMLDAYGRGSRAVKFQAIGWLPLLSVGILRMVSQLTPLLRPTDAMTLLYAGIVFEVLATTMGVADRFLIIRRERDRARTEAGVLEKLSERDPLTGLLNRRAIEPGFQDLLKTGYHTFALLDLDRFKEVNDAFGHAVGDKVLRAVTLAIQRETDTLAVRMGGEEFALVMRGDDTRERAERKRQAIAMVVAREVPELDRVVTASMGLLEVPRNGIPGLGFKDYYALADKLLYNAKAGGRNRSIAEKMQVFLPRKIDRRRKAA